MIPLTWFTVILLIGCICLMASRLNLTRASHDLRRQEEDEAKGLKLLIENLTAEQIQQYDRFGYFDVVGSKTGKRYRICHGTSRNVNELLEENRLGSGRCFMPRGNLVAGDCMLAQKIMLENREEEVLRVANTLLMGRSDVRCCRHDSMSVPRFVSVQASPSSSKRRP